MSFRLDVRQACRGADGAATGSLRVRAGGWFARDEAIMARPSTSSLGARTSATRNAPSPRVMDEMHRIDHTMSPHKPESELSRINRDAA